MSSLEPTTSLEPISLAVVGSRSFTNYALLATVLDTFQKVQPVKRLVSGGAEGADRLAEEYARKHNMDILVLKGEWTHCGKDTAMRDSCEIVKEADEVIAFWDGKSIGTQYTIQKMQWMNKVVRIIKV